MGYRSNAQLVLPEPVQRIRPEEWEEQVILSREPVLVDMNGMGEEPLPSHLEALEWIRLDFQGRIRVSILDLSMVFSKGQASWFHQEPILVLFKEGRVITSISGAERALKMRTWLSLVRDWSPQFLGSR